MRLERAGHIAPPVAAGLSPGEIVASCPPLRVDEVRAATAYAAEPARERIVEIDNRGAA
jgi:uncharacterized protein (DUF433 family)